MPDRIRTDATATSPTDSAPAAPEATADTQASRKPRRYNPHEVPPPPAAETPPPLRPAPGPTTLWNLVELGIDVFCWCNRCSHHATIPVKALAAQMGPMTPVPEVAARLVCSGCGGREVVSRPAWPPCGPVSRHSG